MKRNFIFFTVVLLGLLTKISNAQVGGSPNESPNEYLTRIVPPSPDAASLGKYGDIPVSLYSGVPQVSVPLGDLKGIQLSVPLSLSYHAGGHKVEETASWVGLGWSLNAGGVITRTVRGFADEREHGFIGMTDEQLALLENCESDWREEVRNGNLDSQVDLFHFNVHGAAGKFFFSNTGEIILETPQHYQIIPGFGSEGIISWTLITDDGTTYYFNNYEVTMHRTIYGNTQTPPEFSITSWYLTRIVSPDKLDQIDFEYFPYQLQQELRMSIADFTSRKIFAGSCPSGENFVCPSYLANPTFLSTNVNGLHIKKIITSRFEAEFEGAYPRLDLPGQNALSSISLKTRRGEPIKSYTLSYGSFASGRLKLLSIQEHGHLNSTENEHIPPIEFAYNEMYDLPDIDSNAQDHWGFYNGKDNSTLVPAYSQYYDPVLQLYRDLPGANREPSIHGLAYLLNEIKYPTGGKTVFDFELHDYGWVGNTKVNELVHRDTAVQAFVNPPGPSCILTEEVVSDQVIFQIGYQQEVRFFGSLSQCPPTPYSNAPKVRLQAGDASGAIILEFVPGKDDEALSFNEYVSLDAGTYRLMVESGVYDRGASAILQFKKDPYFITTKKAGGARIKRITNLLPNGEAASDKFYSYENEDGDGSSGVLIGEPVFSHIQQDQHVKTCSPSHFPYAVAYDCDYFVRSSHTQMPLSSTSGSHVGYYRVGLLSPGNGSEVSYYTSGREYPDSGERTFPFASKTSNDWARGKMTVHEIRNEEGILVHKTNNQYSLVQLGSVPSVVVRRKNLVDVPFPPEYECKAYYNLTGLVQLVESTETAFESNGSFVKSVSYTYDSHKGTLPTEILTTGSRGEVNKKVIRYPFDIADIAGISPENSLALQRLLNDNRINVPIEIVEFTNDLPERKTRTDYHVKDITNPMFPEVESIIVIEKINEAIRLEPLQVIANFSFYDDGGRPRQYMGKDGVPNALLWDERNGQLMAHATNCRHGHLSFTSFEHDGVKGNWEYSLLTNMEGKTGGRSQVTGSPITRSGLDPQRRYHVSFWSKNGVPHINNIVENIQNTAPMEDGWQFTHVLISGSPTITIAGTNNIVIDELKLYPERAHIQTFQFSSAGLLVSAGNGPYNLIAYEYDALSRLRLSEDEETHIISKLQYFYGNHNHIRRTLLRVPITSETVISELEIGQKAETVDYVDGLGRLEQKIQTQASPAKRDLIHPVVYDNHGREARQFLPIAIGNDGEFKDGLFENHYYTGAARQFYDDIESGIARDEKPFSEKFFEASPLNRVHKHYAPGKAWDINEADKPVTYKHLVNEHGTEPGQERIVAFLWDQSIGTLTRHQPDPGFIEDGGFFSSGQLSVYMTTDEQGGILREYKDKSGRVVLRKTYNEGNADDFYTPGNWAETYYVYDNSDNLITVLQPEAVMTLLQPNQTER